MPLLLFCESVIENNGFFKDQRDNKKANVPNKRASVPVPMVLMSQVHIYLSQVHITTFLVLPEACGRIIRIMRAGGDMIHCQSLTMRVQRSYMTIFFV